MQQHEIRAWLGPAYDKMTEEQVADFTLLVQRIEDRYPSNWQHRDESEPGSAMMVGALQVLIGDSTLEGLGDEWAQAKAAERAAMKRLWGGIMVADARLSEVEISRRANVSRVTVRKALGK